MSKQPMTDKTPQVKRDEIKRLNEILKQLRSNPCEWCSETSDKIDSLEFQMGGKEEEIADLKQELTKSKTCLDNTMKIENSLHEQLADSVPKSAAKKMLEILDCRCGDRDCTPCQQTEWADELLKDNK